MGSEMTRKISQSNPDISGRYGYLTSDSMKPTEHLSAHYLSRRRIHATSISNYLSLLLLIYHPTPVPKNLLHLASYERPKLRLFATMFRISNKFNSLE